MFFDNKNAKFEKFNLYSLNKENIDFAEPISFGFCLSKYSKLILYEC